MLKISRNSLCLCGSGKKYKKCCFLDPEKNQEIEHALKKAMTIEEAKKIISMPVLLYKIKVELIEHPVYELEHEVSKTFLISGKESLYDLHMKIQRAFNWDNDHMFSFYLSGKFDKQETEYSAAPDGEYLASRWRNTKSASEAEIRDLAFHVGMKFQYLFDYGDQLQHEISVLKIESKSENDELHFNLIESIGECPDQYDSY